MSPAEYNIRMEAFGLKHEDEQRLMHEKIWLEGRVVAASDKNNKYIFKNFEEFYKPVVKDSAIFDELHQRRRNLKAYHERKEG